ncbi:hypothetical protein WJX84_002907 [Apatococcus fuscideae]|uniref:Uncharacterized protein n=1 Tax=Apatococcus fuscideae TaxID=2026836 RepID=A0AAW1SQA4_9CHLO
MDPAPDYGYETYKGSEKLKGKVSIVTGGDSGIGRAIAMHYAREGAHICIAYLNEHEDAEQIKKHVLECGVECILVPGDISKEETCKDIVDKTVAKWGKVDILVNNAAYQGPMVDDFRKLSRERLEYTFKTNIIAYFSMAQKCVEHMAKGSAIVDVCSINAYMPQPAILDYASTKGAIVTFTKGLSHMLIAKGIRVNCIAPGPVWTPLVPSSFDKETVAHFGKETVGTPIQRPAQPKEYGPVAVFLADESQSSYILGAVLAVTGGMLIS